MLFLFCDTMVYLHYKRFTEIDFCSLLNEKEITIVVPEVVVQEIDKHKDNHSQSKIRTRAGKISGLFYKYLIEESDGEYQINNNIRIRYLPITSFDFKSHNLNPERQDHQLIAVIIQFKQNISNQDSLVFLTHDNGSSFLAKQKGIQLYRLPDTEKLIDELDSNEKKIKSLEAELMVLKNAQPQLMVYANGQKQSHKITIKIEKLPALIPSATLAKIMEKFPRREPLENNQPELKTAVASLRTWTTIEPAEYDRYNVAREVYFEEYNKYLEAIKRHNEKYYAMLYLQIGNSGTAPAKNIDIYMHFPDGFEMFRGNSYPNSPKAPPEPTLPRTNWDIRMSNMPNLRDINFSPVGKEINYSRDTFSLKKTNSYELNERIESLKHNYEYNLAPLIIVFDKIESVTNFNVTYTLLADNIPMQNKGTVYFEVKVQP